MDKPTHQETAERMTKMHGKQKAIEWAWEHAFANSMDFNPHGTRFWCAVYKELTGRDPRGKDY